MHRHLVDGLGLFGLFVWLTVMAAFANFAFGNQPNIILMMADDFGAECVGAYGGVSYQTSRLDRLAERGVLFEHAYSNPICTPSRVKIMTGKYNVRNYERFGYLPSGETTFANYLQAAGYRTCIVGKWQLGDLRRIDDFGFDQWRVWGPVHGSRYAQATLNTNGTVEFHAGEYGPDLISDFACDFIRDCDSEGAPFLLYYPMLLPHYPWEPTPWDADYDRYRVWPGAEEKGDVAYFPSMVKYLNRMVGNIVYTINNLGIRRQTLLVFTGDNGSSRRVCSAIADGTLVDGGKGLMTNAGTHVPFIASWPGTLPEGVYSDTLVDFSDILPTLLAVAGTTWQDSTIDGWLIPEIALPMAESRWFTYCWYQNLNTYIVDSYARTRGWKLYRNGDFFCVRTDPMELDPLPPAALNSKQLKTYHNLQAKLQSLDSLR